MRDKISLLDIDSKGLACRVFIHGVYSEFALYAEAASVPIDRSIRLTAPDDNEPTAYDRSHLMTYARLIDADDSGIAWTAAAQSILGLRLGANLSAPRRCWETHLARARWIVGEGLESAVEAFGRKTEP